MGGVQSCLVILRIFREMCQRDPAWRPVTDWVSLIMVCFFHHLLTLVQVVECRSVDSLSGLYFISLPFTENLCFLYSYLSQAV